MTPEKTAPRCFTVRPAVSRDIPAVAEIYRQAAANYDGWQPNIYPVAQTARDALKKGELFVAETDDGAIAGSVILHDVNHPSYRTAPWRVSAQEREVWVISTLAVGDAYRGQGAAKAMLRYARTAGLKAGKRVLRLDVNCRNDKAICLYEQCGFCYAGDIALDGESYMDDAYRLYELDLGATD